MKIQPKNSKAVMQLFSIKEYTKRMPFDYTSARYNTFAQTARFNIFYALFLDKDQDPYAVY